MDQLKTLLDAEGLSYYLDPNRPVYLLGFTGLFGSYQVLATIQADDLFFQLRTVHYLKCPKGHKSLTQVHKAMADMNYAHRLVKFGWDARDGEISVTADHWVMDTNVSQQQIHRLLGNFLQPIDLGYERLRKTIETGKDPGPIDEKELAKKLALRREPVTEI